MGTLTVNESSMLQATMEHNKMITKIKQLMDRTRARKTNEFKKKMLENTIDTLNKRGAQSKENHEQEDQADLMKVKEEHSEKDKLFFTK